MAEEKLHSYLAEIIEREPAGQLDVWAAVQGELRNELSRRTQVRRRVRLALAGAALTLVLALGITTYTLATAPFDRAGEIASWNDAGMAHIYQSGLYHTVGISQTLQDVTVIIDWVYVDPVRTFIGYRILSGPRTQYYAGAKIESATDNLGTGLVRYDMFGDTGNYQEVKRIESFLSPAAFNNVNISEIDLKISVQLEGLPINPPPAPGWLQDATGGWYFTPKTDGVLNFHLTSPVAAGHTINVGQVQQSDGVAITLERIVLAGSGVIADVCFDPPDANRFRWSVDARLSSGSATYQGLSAGDNQAVPANGTNYLCQPVVFQDAAGIESGTVTVHITSLEGSGLQDNPTESRSIEGDWSFAVVATP